MTRRTPRTKLTGERRTPTPPPGPLAPSPPQAPPAGAALLRPRRSAAAGLGLLALAVVALWLLVYGAWIAPTDPGSRDLAELGTLLLILLFVGSALLGRRLRTGEVVRGIVAWGVIGVLVLAVYGYRTELASVGGRVLSAFVPGVPLAGRLAGQSDAASVVVIRSPNGLFAVRAHVDDVPLTLLVDPGASFVTLTLADAVGIGIDPQTLDFTVPIRTANGLIKAAPVTLDSLVVGTIERQRLSALVAPPDSLTQSLLGMTFLETLGGYAISGDRMVLNN